MGVKGEGERRESKNAEEKISANGAAASDNGDAASDDGEAIAADDVSVNGDGETP